MRNLIEELTGLIEDSNTVGIERFKERLNDWLIGEEERNVLKRLCDVSVHNIEEIDSINRFSHLNECI